MAAFGRPALRRNLSESGSDSAERRKICLVPASAHFYLLSQMANGPILLRENRYHQIKAILARLRLDSSARLVVLVDKDGQQIAVHGELGDLDTTSLASLVAGNVAATGGM